MPDNLTITDAGYLADIMRAVDRKDNVRLTWYPFGGDNPEIKTTYVIRAITHDGGGFWFDPDGDVRDAYLWLSGTTERWLKISDLMDALRAMTGNDTTVPLATIEAK